MTDVTVQDRGDGRVALAGRLDMATVPVAWAAVQPLLSARDTVLDLSNVAQADSAGLALLVECARAVRRAGGQVGFVGVPESLLGIARVSGVEAWLREGPPPA